MLFQEISFRLSVFVNIIMLKNNLINSCTCGNKNNFDRKIINDIDTLECKFCGVIHQELIGWNKTKLSYFYKNEYHRKFQEEKGVTAYQDRYQHDCNVADLRLDAYQPFLSHGTLGLDIGSSNSAFVHRAISRGYRCKGLEIGNDIGDSSVTIRGSLGEIFIEPDSFDWITMHDSIEHMVDVVNALQEVRRLLRSSGLVIIDLPDFWNTAGRHHWKEVEHLWFYTAPQMTSILEQSRFCVVDVKCPLPGKLVFYARKI